MVNFLSESDAQKQGLAYVNDAGNFVMAVDSTNPVGANGNRNSVRIFSPNPYNTGLFIADIKHMPVGCSVWPAYWTVGPNWPSGGEIDVLEGVHNQYGNQMTLHTSPSPGCQAANNVPATARLATQQCAVLNGDNTGCAFVSDDGSSYGTGFNNVGGGVYAHQWTASAIKIWFFPRSQIPQDIYQETPNPSGWGEPDATWSANSCDIGSHFSDHVITFDITLCGDWAGATFNSAGCPGTCAQFVANPDNFKNAFWEVQGVRVYQ
ncbi:glycoside hydrolase family 16 protein [Pluteus cervinus]|uniref:Glycoside hydrolase family 16 protein n=1 Tax=Pluteus cervinus TaxID=181527 RepID=A0ACD3AEC0_9AGAR|nr:glycoside hydrolase family 16 protein [Pluteus cervinus]